ncbi:MAG: hypothetical protein K9W43_04375 [Candidatus Thorarchaeota archaeon]|nr:hypothetical protein [Candidatus Thorarchaeota archaeon]
MVVTLSGIELRIQNPHWGRFIGLTVACAFLNIGLYFMMYFLTPILAGTVVGFLLGHKKQSPMSGAFGALGAYIALFTYVSMTTSLQSGLVEIVVASLLLAGVGFIGGIIGMFIRGTRLR